MAEGICSISTYLQSSARLTTQANCDVAFDTKYQEASNIALIAAPLFLVYLTAIKSQAESEIKLSQELYQGRILAGVTRILRPFRTQVNDISSALAKTKAANCADVNSLQYLYDTSPTVMNVTKKTKLADSPRKIGEIYAESFVKCTQEPIANLRAKLDKISKLLQVLQSNYVEKGEELLRLCKSLGKEVAVDQCFPNYINGFKDLLKDYVKNIPQQQSLYDTIFQLKIFEQDTFFVPKCLGFASIDASVAANIMLRDIQSCAQAAGVAVSVKDIPVLDPVTTLPSLFPQLEPFYINNEAFQKQAKDSFIVVIDYLNNEIKKINAEKLRYKTVTAESYLASNVNVLKAQKSAGASNNITLQTCVKNAYNFTKTKLETDLRISRDCLDNHLNYVIILLGYLKSSLIDILPVPRVNFYKGVPVCISFSTSIQENSTVQYDDCYYFNFPVGAFQEYSKIKPYITNLYIQNKNYIKSCGLKVNIYQPIDACDRIITKASPIEEVEI